MTPTFFLIFSGVLSVGSVVYLTRLARHSFQRIPSAEQRIPSAEYTAFDAVISLALVSLFLSNIANDPGKPMVINRQVLLAGALLSFFLITIVCCLLIVRGRNPVRLFGLRWTDWKAGLPAVGLTLLAILPLVIFLHQLTNLIIGPDAKPQEIIEFLLTHRGLADQLAVAGTALIVAPLSEELIFRGYLYGVVKKYGGPWCAIGVSSLLFAAVHLNNAAFFALAALGVALCLIYERCGTLWAPVLVHVGFNATTLISSLLWPVTPP